MKKNLFLRLCLMATIILSFYSCRQEYLQTEQENARQSQKTTVQHLLREELEKQHSRVLDKINQLSAKSNSLNRTIYTDEENEFSIDTDQAYFVQDAHGIKTYTFKIERESETEEGSLENLILKDIGEDNFFAYFIRYDAAALNNSQEKPLSPEELIPHISLYAVGKKTSVEIFGKYDSCPMVFYPVGTYVYVPGHQCVEGLHDYGEPCAYLGTSDAATDDGYQVVYNIVVNEPSGSCSGGGFEPSASGTMGTTPTHSGGAGTSLTNDCDKVKKPFIDNPTLKAETQTLATKTSDTDEHAITVTKNPDPTNPVFHVPVGAPGAIDITKNPANIYTFVAHSHNSPAMNTYSVPGWGDLEWIFGTYQIYHKIDSNTVFVVITSDGTRYALTISNWEKFTRIFYSPKNTMPEELEKGGVASIIAKKYYGEEVMGGSVNMGLIKESNVNNEQDLIYFLQMIKENDMGINVFEINSDYTQFSRLFLKNNNTQVDRKPCN